MENIKQYKWSVVAYSDTDKIASTLFESSEDEAHDVAKKWAALRGYNDWSVYRVVSNDRD